MTPNIVDSIVKKFGTQAALAEAIGIDQSTIAHWKREGREIPTRQQKRILEVARERGIDIQPGDFFGDMREAS